MITIEFSEPSHSVCECCGEKATSLTRFVYNDDNAHAVYYCKFTDNHDDKKVYGVISLGVGGGKGQNLRKELHFHSCFGPQNHIIK